MMKLTTLRWQKHGDIMVAVDSDGCKRYFVWYEVIWNAWQCCGPIGLVSNAEQYGATSKREVMRRVRKDWKDRNSK